MENTYSIISIDHINKVVLVKYFSEKPTLTAGQKCFTQPFIFMDKSYFSIRAMQYDTVQFDEMVSISYYNSLMNKYDLSSVPENKPIPRGVFLAKKPEKPFHVVFHKGFSLIEDKCERYTTKERIAEFEKDLKSRMEIV